MDFFKVGNLKLAAVTINNVINFINENIGKKNGYICVANTRTAYLSSIDTNYCKIQNNSLITIPDGMPLVWLGRASGFSNIKRTAGPDLFKNFLKHQSNDIKHYFLGDTEDVLKRLNKKTLNKFKSNVVGSFSPPFLSVEEYDYKSIANEINKSNADLVWLALGSPKQDFFASKLEKYTDKKIIINVGAAFRFILGEYNMPSHTVQKFGLTGVYWRFKEKPILFLKLYPKYFIFVLYNFFKIKFKNS